MEIVAIILLVVSVVLLGFNSYYYNLSEERLESMGVWREEYFTQIRKNKLLRDELMSLRDLLSEQSNRVIELVLEKENAERGKKVTVKKSTKSKGEAKKKTKGGSR